MATQVQTIPIDIGLSTATISSVRGNYHASVSARARLLNIDSPLDNLSPRFATGFGLGLPSPPPEADNALPTIHSGSVDSLLRAGILEAAMASSANQPDAEAAFFIADLGYIYRQHKRWQECLPHVTPCYGEQFRFLLICARSSVIN